MLKRAVALNLSMRVGAIRNVGFELIERFVAVISECHIGVNVNRLGEGDQYSFVAYFDCANILRSLCEQHNIVLLDSIEEEVFTR